MYNILSSHQFGFREKFSTELAITDIHEKLLHNLDKGLSSCSIFLDLAKAFDSVSHPILLRKLEKYGIRGIALKLFKSYLSNRSQFVKLNQVESSRLQIDFGVPQGSILGPLLFLIFINDLPEATNFMVRLFADDTFLCAENTNFSDLKTEVNLELTKVFEWLSSNKLTLNMKKSKFMIITNKKKKDIPNFTVKIDSRPLEECNSYKYLGIHIDNKLTWDTHVCYLVKKISKACGALAKLRHSVPTKILMNVYYALVYSYLRYSISVWGNASDAVLQPLQTIMNKALRILTFAPFGHIDLQPMFDHLKVLNVKQIFSLETGKFLFKSKNNMLPISIGGYFEPDPFVNQHNYGLRSRTSNQPIRLVCRTKSGEKSLQIRGEKFWNDLPELLKESESFCLFKKNLKKYLLEP